jgi:hypothetical protein
MLTVILTGIDRNSGEAVPASLPIVDAIHIQIKPRLTIQYQISKPISARESKVLSHGQTLEIEVWADSVQHSSILEYAAIFDTGSIKLDDRLFSQFGYSRIDGETYEKTFTRISQRLTFRVRAPVNNISSDLIFRFNRLPGDTNSGNAVNTDSGLPLTIPMTVRQKNVTVALVDSLITNTNFTRGPGMHTIMAFRISNEGYINTLFVNYFDVRFTTSYDTTSLSDEAVFNMIDSIKVVNSDLTETYAEYQLSEGLVSNPLRVNFDRILELDADSTETLLLLIKFRSQAVSRGFRTHLTWVNAYEDSPLYPVAIVDDAGNPISESSNFQSRAYSVISNDPKENFATYPNPFGRVPNELATIRFSLRETSDVQIRIYTLVGELVKSEWDQQLSGLARGLYDGYIRWDGRNDRGYRVLNGVYLCTIEIRSDNATDRFVTKMAYIK